MNEHYEKPDLEILRERVRSKATNEGNWCVLAYTTFSEESFCEL